jgi:hypothetical protein
MRDEIFLSASVPIPGRGEYYKTADPLLIQSAVRALAEIVLGRRRIVWGGHPTITPMLMEACVHLGVSYSNSVTLYQSEFFEDEFPEENAFFGNVEFTEAVKDDREASLLLMRQKMLSRPNLSAAVFIGGMNGVSEEVNLFRAYHPQATQVFVGSTGGAALEHALVMGMPEDETLSIDYFKLFHTQLGIAADEPRDLLDGNGNPTSKLRP